jgi:hypothetical protein
MVGVGLPADENDIEPGPFRGDHLLLFYHCPVGTMLSR